jgi:hypothetical protein
MAATTARILERRGGVPIPWEEIERALDMDAASWEDDRTSVGRTERSGNESDEHSPAPLISALSSGPATAGS